MNSLKKTLSLALVFVMVFGLMLTASAADFSDIEDVQYTEAVEVMTGIGAINGFPDGTFNPDGLVTRAQAAKMIAYATLGPAVADNLVATGKIFKDVPTTHWGAAFVEYLYSRGIVAGKSADRFDPNGNVTTYELAKMILASAGYGKNGEYVGASWLINVAIDATDLKVVAGLKDTNYADAATREEAALMIFNGVSKVNVVVYSKDTESYSDAKTGTPAASYTIGQQKFGLNAASATVNGVSGYTWKNTAGKALSSFVVTENVLGTSMSGKTVADLSTKTNPAYIADLDSTVSYFFNGTAVPAYTAGTVYAIGDLVVSDNKLYEVTAAHTATATLASAALYTPVKGEIVKFVDAIPNGKADKVAITLKTVGVVGIAPYVNPTTGNVTILGLGISNVDAKTVSYPADLAAGDIVLLYVDGNGVTNIEKAAVVKGQMTSATTSVGAIGFAGASYTESGLVASPALATFYGNSANFNKDATAFLDNNGYIVNISLDVPVASTAKYGLVVGYQFTDVVGTGPLATPASAKVLLYTEDGAAKVYDQAPNALGVVVNAGITGNATFVTYSINADGKATVTPVATTGVVGATAYTAKSPVIQIGAANFYVTSDTKVVYFDSSAAYPTSKASFVTGYSKTVAAATGKAVAYSVAGTSSNLEAIYVDVAPGTTTVAGNYAYIHALNVGPSIRYANGVAFYDYTAYVNGVATTLTSKTGTFFAAAGQYSYTLDSDGYVVATPALAGGLTDTTTAGTGKINYVDSGFVAYVDGTTNKSVPVAATTAYYQVTATGVTAAPIALNPFVTYTIAYIQTNTDGVAVAIYYTVS